MLVEPIIARIEAFVPALVRRLQGAGELSALIKSGSLPQVTPAGFVLPLGVRGGDADAVTGLFRQMTEETVAVVLVIEAAGEGTGARALPEIDALKDAVVGALAGWAPNDAIGVFRLGRGQLVSLVRGTVIYQLDFVIQHQLRIT